MIIFGISFVIFLALRLGLEKVDFFAPAIPFFKGIYIGCLVAFVVCAVVKIIKEIKK